MDDFALCMINSNLQDALSSLKKSQRIIEMCTLLLSQPTISRENVDTALAWISRSNLTPNEIIHKILT